MLIPLPAYRLYNRIRKGHSNAQCFAYYLEFVTFHIPQEKFIPALEWLAKHASGDRFVELVETECKGSGLELVRQITMRLEKEKKPRKLYAVDVK